MEPEFPHFSDPQVSPCWWSRKDTLSSKALKYKSLTHLQHSPSAPLHGLCNNHQSNPARWNRRCAVLCLEWQPRTQRRPPGAPPTAGRTVPLRTVLGGQGPAGPLLHRRLALPHPKESRSGVRFLTRGHAEINEQDHPSAPSPGRVGRPQLTSPASSLLRAVGSHLEAGSAPRGPPAALGPQSQEVANLTPGLRLLASTPLPAKDAVRLVLAPPWLSLHFLLHATRVPTSARPWM